jgi:hypothetical protein
MQLSLGSISHGTLKSEDLACAIADALASVGHAESELLMRELRGVANGNVEDGGEIVSDGIDAMQEHCPAYCYAGMHEGDGSDLGIWFDHNAFEEACRDGEILKVSDLSELDDMDKESIVSHNYIAHVSDHGNVTLYGIHVTVTAPIWAIV